MAKLCLRLENKDGSFREYRMDKIPARLVREALIHSRTINELEKKDDAVAVLDERLKFTCSLFGDKELTPDAILDGLENETLFPTLDEIFSEVLGNKDKTEQGK